MTLKEMRENANLTRMQVGFKLNVSESCLAHWELGDQTPAKKYRAKLAKMYGVTVKELVEASEADVIARRNRRHLREVMRENLEDA